mmetsp:Transcript_19013/g.61231  ORF Transcript_19013/g.61231 Transcript_19013/m.61231 type:complete len:207 (+) Transcript_19013:413-1033(+)
MDGDGDVVVEFGVEVAGEAVGDDVEGRVPPGREGEADVVVSLFFFCFYLDRGPAVSFCFFDRDGAAVAKGEAGERPGEGRVGVELDDEGRLEAPRRRRGPRTKEGRRGAGGRADGARPPGVAPEARRGHGLGVRRVPPRDRHTPGPEPPRRDDVEALGRQLVVPEGPQQLGHHGVEQRRLTPPRRFFGQIAKVAFFFFFFFFGRSF